MKPLDCWLVSTVSVGVIIFVWVKSEGLGTASNENKSPSAVERRSPQRAENEIASDGEPARQAPALDEFESRWKRFGDAGSDVSRNEAVRELAALSPIRTIESLSERLPAHAFFDQAATAVGKWIETDPEAAVIWCFEKFSGPEAGELGRYAVESWANGCKSTEKVANWALSSAQLTQDHKMAAVESLMVDWGTKDPVALTAWAAGLKPDQLDNSAISQLVFTIAATDREAALAWNERVTDASVRQSNIDELKSMWTELDANK